MSRELTLQQAAKMALDVQNACNLSGIVRSFSDCMAAIWREADRLGKGTDWCNRHPIAILFVSKICDLSRYTYPPGETENFSKASDECERLATTGGAS